MCLLVSELCGCAGGMRAGPSEHREAQRGRYPVTAGQDGSSAPETELTRQGVEPHLMKAVPCKI